MENPTGTSKANETQNQRDSENRISETPNAAAAMAIHLPKPFNVSRVASRISADQRADAGSAHQHAQAARSAVQNLVGEDRHQDGE